MNKIEILNRMKKLEEQYENLKTVKRIIKKFYENDTAYHLSFKDEYGNTYTSCLIPYDCKNKKQLEKAVIGVMNEIIDNNRREFYRLANLLNSSIKKEV